MSNAAQPNRSRPLWAARLERARLAAGYKTAIDFARFMGMSQQRYANYESGAREPNLQLLAEMCAALRVSADYIIFGRDSRDAA